MDSHNPTTINQLPKLDDIIELSEQEKKQLGLLDTKSNNEKDNDLIDAEAEEYNEDNIH